MPIRLQKEPEMCAVTPVENLFLSQYMPAAPGEYVKVYLFGLMQCTDPAQTYDMAGALGIAEADIVEAYRYWESLGLVRLCAGEPPVAEYRSLSGLIRAAKQPQRRYAALITALQNPLGTRVLSGTELSRVYDWIEVYDMEEAAVVMLVRHCVARKGARVSINYMDAVARNWADRAILTVEAVEAYLKAQEEAGSGAQAVLKRFNLARRPTADELALYEKWTNAWGFDEAAVLAACVETTGSMKPSFKYLDAILESCRMEGAGLSGVECYLNKRDAQNELSRLVFERAGIKRIPTAVQREQIGVWSTQWHLPNEVTLYAAELSFGGSSPFANLKRLLEHWHKLGVSDLAGARGAYEREATLQKGKGGNAMAALQYPQRKYTEEDFKHMGFVPFGDDEDAEEDL